MKEETMHYARYVGGRECSFATFNRSKVTCDICLSWLEKEKEK